MFLQVSVILSTGEGLHQVVGSTSRGGSASRRGILHPGIPWDKVNERAVRILLECILVFTARKRSLGQGNILHLFVILFTGGGSAPGGGVPGLGGGAWSGGGCLVPGGCVVETPRDGYCCGRYASYWNAFLFCSARTYQIHFKLYCKRSN